MVGAGVWFGALLQSYLDPWWTLASFIPLIICRIFFNKKSSAAVVITALLVGGIALSIRQADIQNHQIIGQGKFAIEITSDPKAKKVLGKTQGIPILLLAPGISNLIPSTLIEVNGSATKTKEAKVAALIYANKVEVIQEANAWQKLLAGIRNGLREKVGKDDAGSLIPGMVLGDTTLQSNQFTNAMRRAGLTHLTAVSGANFAIVSSFLLWLMQWPIRKIHIRLSITSLFLIAFILLVRPSPSVLRAAAMAGVVIFARLNRNRSDSIPALGFAIALVVLCDPWQSKDPGFALSVLATAGILLIAPKLKLPEIIATPIAATLFCAPIIISLSGYLSFSSIPANVLAAPFVAPITILGFCIAILPFTSPILLPIVKILAGIIVKIAWLASNFPVLQITYLVFLFFATLIFFSNKKVFAILFLAILLLTWLQRWPNCDWQVANCDVGQGDALVVKVTKEQGAVFDVGPDPKLISECLSQLGIKAVPLLLITHPHADHGGGIIGVPNVGKLITKANRGDRYRVGSLEIEILWPTRQGFEFKDLGEEGSALNNQSIVAKVTSPDFTLLVTGDLEPEAQSQVAPFLTPVDIYKVAHHGSKFQDEFFTSKIQPKISIISVGRNNKYGHPNPKTLELLAKSRVLRTDLDGAIAIDFKHNKISSSKVGVFGLPVLWRVA